ncbi:MAG: pterin-4-alpha-carbinolamine dehydratase [Runella slithyformis]|nr:MAG: pterin-4-alpha-carbinolamine dehydratase [Runella slithyformis]TAE99395.1 MAG: pterin-4-alpha-carbinolamine dehydratase [Runella slithyformis]TAF30036.1 MAG: pterin-4-alpha-carbinolamine dehydratase [Runella slithyformis]TAF49152.1 MAG: pterin-4-alpha-carbinolamine dehydratase [Runella slithyformis]TAF83634.1 MAG: pterin-4-alpha-carbinolamine dehydratase [Runella slithyformis]
MFIEQNNKMTAEYEFEDFNEAFAFMTKVAAVAEAMGHHPWWSNVYNKVRIELTTHDAGNTVTEKDEKLAEAIDQIFDEM